MSEQNFTFSEPLDLAEGKPAQTLAAPADACAAFCPLARIPAEVWKDVLRPPFRKRHPWLFWTFVVALRVGLGSLPTAFSSTDGIMGGSRLALVSISGPIMDVGPTLRWIRTVGNDEDIKGVLVRVDSPGGGAAASQEVYAALRRLAEKKPVAVSMGSMAASGGLMVSMAGRRIFANASTVTGSIGVRMDIPQVQGLLAKLGLGQETVTTAPYKDAGSYLRPLSSEQRAYFQGVLDDMHAQFVEIVAEGRHMDKARASSLADGKIMTGREALHIGLVDALGGEDEALQWLAEQCGVPVERKLQMRPKEDGWLPRSLKTWLRMELEDGLGALATGSLQPVFLFQM
ncbi:MAG: signal peptide peptidase SppA [Desulfovibrio sp.]|nr:signal peptide peptidase SppA [Desulfovibrio sp.]